MNRFSPHKYELIYDKMPDWGSKQKDHGAYFD